MNDLISAMQKVLAEFDQATERFSDREIADRVRRLRPKTDTTAAPMEWLAELMAFQFSEDYQGDEPAWGTYFGPELTFKDADGQAFAVPDIGDVSPEIIAYWKERATSSRHPLLRYRYSDLVWDMSRKVAGRSADVSYPRAAIDAILEIARGNLHKWELVAVHRLRRALSLAQSIRDNSRRDQVKAAIIDLESRVAQDDKVGLCGFSYDILVESKVPGLTAAEEASIVADLERRLDRLVHPSDDLKSDPWGAEHLATKLATYYRKLGRQADVERVLRMVGQAFQTLCCTASGMFAHATLERLHQVYSTFGMRSDAEEIALELRAVGPKLLDEMKPLATKFEIPEDQMRAHVQGQIAGDLPTALIRIATLNLHRKSKVQEQVRDLATQAPLLFLITTQLKDHEGRTVASIGPVESDFPGHVVRQMAQNMYISSVFLREVLRGLVSEHHVTPELLVKHLLQSPVFTDDRRETLLRAIAAYLAEDHEGFIHRIVPQIEKAFRSLVELSGGAVLKPGRNGGFVLKMMNELLREDEVTKAFGEEGAFYFRVLLSDQRGWNVRNDVCHGLLPSAAFNSVISDRLLHVVLCLALLRDKPAGEDGT